MTRFSASVVFFAAAADALELDAALWNHFALSLKAAGWSRCSALASCSLMVRALRCTVLLGGGALQYRHVQLHEADCQDCF